MPLLGPQNPMPIKDEGTCLSLSLQAETVQDTNILIRMKHEEVVFACVVIVGGNPYSP